MEKLVKDYEESAISIVTKAEIQEEIDVAFSLFQLVSIPKYHLIDCFQIESS